MSSHCVYSIYPLFFLRVLLLPLISLFFFFNDTATTEIYTLSLHDALPISHLRAAARAGQGHGGCARRALRHIPGNRARGPLGARSEEHTSELQSQSNLVCRLLLEKKKKKIK